MSYIIELAEELHMLLHGEAPPKSSGLDGHQMFKAISDGLHKMHVEQFAADQQTTFLAVQAAIAKIVQSGNYYQDDATKALPRKVVELVQSYGQLSRAATGKNFSFLSDPDLRTIVERDYQELKGILFPNGAWKSVVILAGSILEAMLFDRLNDPLYFTNATTFSSAPKSGGVVKDLDDWKLVELIRVASGIGLLPTARASAIDQVLRDYRNFVHPKKEIKAQHPCTEAEAQMAVGALDAVYNHFAGP